MKKLIMTTALMIMGAWLCACSDDDNAVSSVEPPAAASDASAFLKVNILAADDVSTRAASASYSYGTEAEQKISSARFFFYDDAGNFVCEASAWDGGTASTSEPAKNIEFESNTILALTGLEDNTYPTQFVTVLNAPTALDVPQTLDALEDALAGGWQNPQTKDFVMSTSSYIREGDTRYYVTPLQSSDFMTSADNALKAKNAVPVYVERLAVKVVVDIDTTKLKALAGQTDTYELGRYTIAGCDTPVTLYVKLVGWGLEGTTKDTYLMKHFDPDQVIDNFNWNPAGIYRTYWAHSYNYGDDTNFNYPDSYTPNGQYGLNYLNADETTLSFSAPDNVAYCNENTNTPAVLADHYPAAITSVLVKARLCNSEGKDLYLILYDGMLFTKEAYLEYVVHALKEEGRLNYLNSNGELLSAADVTIDDSPSLNGQVIVQLKDADGWTVNKKSNPTAVSGSKINTILASFNEGDEAIAYNEGLMYYNIPITHLNTKTAPTMADGKLSTAEGYYGVVRNHCYTITITGIANLGLGIKNAGEPIVPRSADNDNYSVGVSVKTLSWRNVSEDVVL